jgi:hypothetical protein
VRLWWLLANPQWCLRNDRMFRGPLPPSAKFHTRGPTSPIDSLQNAIRVYRNRGRYAGPAVWDVQLPGWLAQSYPAGCQVAAPPIAAMDGCLLCKVCENDKHKHGLARDHKRQIMVVGPDCARRSSCAATAPASRWCWTASMCASAKLHKQGQGLQPIYSVQPIGRAPNLYSRRALSRNARRNHRLGHRLNMVAPK